MVTIRHWIIEQFLEEQLVKGLWLSGINVLFWPHSASAVATSKASVYSLPLDQILLTSEHS